MIKYLSFILFLTLSNWSFAQNPVGKWKVTSHISQWQGQIFDSHAALLTQRPCAAKFFYNIQADGSYRLDASQSGCDDKFVKIQEKLYSETVWTVTGNVITIGNKKTPTIGQKYTFTISGNKMVWEGLDGQDTITYKKL